MTELTTLTPVASPVTETPQRSGTPVPAWRRLRIFGTGFGVAVSNGDLEAVIVRSRPSRSSLVASLTIHNFAARQAAEWGAELLRFLKAAGEPRLAGTVVLPREEVIVRTVRLPGVADKDVASAIELQLDTLHPWDEEAIEWAWWRVSVSEVVVGIARQSTLSRYETLFSEAGIPMAGATFSSAVIHAALRLQHAAPKSVFCYMLPGNGRIEVYGESEARPCYSAEYALSTERALAVARAELRLPPEYVAAELGEALTAPPSISPLAFAAALAASAPLSVRFANLLPAARRASHSRTQYLIPVALTALVAIGLVTVFVLFPVISERRYVQDLAAEQNRLAPIALRVQAIDKTLAAHRARIAALDDFRRRPQADLDVLNELVRILPEKVWTDSIEIFPDSVVIGGEADQAEPLLKLFESSPLFQNAQFVMSVAHKGDVDVFRIKAIRRGRAGRNTP